MCFGKELRLGKEQNAYFFFSSKKPNQPKKKSLADGKVFIVIYCSGQKVIKCVIKMVIPLQYVMKCLHLTVRMTVHCVAAKNFVHMKTVTVTRKKGLIILSILQI